MIRAAGGILEKQTHNGSEIVVIFRTRYGAEWCLPKGKVEEGESLENAARREVEEETGCKPRIKSFAGSTHYLVKGTPKTVFYWVMEPEGEFIFKPSSEVERMEWLPVKEALERLSHEDEKKLISNVYRVSLKHGE